MLPRLALHPVLANFLIRRQRRCCILVCHRVQHGHHLCLSSHPAASHFAAAAASAVDSQRRRSCLWLRARPIVARAASHLLEWHGHGDDDDHHTYAYGRSRVRPLRRRRRQVSHSGAGTRAWWQREDYGARNPQQLGGLPRVFDEDGGIALVIIVISPDERLTGHLPSGPFWDLLPYPFLHSAFVSFLSIPIYLSMYLLALALSRQSINSLLAAHRPLRYSRAEGW